MSPVVLRGSRGVAALLAGFGIALGVLAVLFAIDAPRGFLVLTVFLGACSAALLLRAATLLVPGLVALRIDDEGIHHKNLRRVDLFRWEDIERFGIAAKTKNGWSVGLRLRRHHPRYDAAASFELDVMLGDEWQLNRDALKALLEDRHREALTRPEPGARPTNSKRHAGD